MNNVCPIIKQVNYKQMSKQQLLDETTNLEVLADHYSRTDWESYNRVMEQLKNIDAILLDIYTKENESFLQPEPA